MLDKLAADQKYAHETLKVDSTPTFFVNGERLKRFNVVRGTGAADQATPEDPYASLLFCDTPSSMMASTNM
jgi:hypothetical protein